MSVPRTIALLGNPNCGKTTLFNALTGLNQKIGNYPGVTVDRKIGKWKISPKDTIRLVDLPGTYSLYPSAEDDRITCQVLWDKNHPDHPDLVVVVVDTTQIRRGLLLTTMVVDLGFPVILALNMTDLAEKQSFRLNRELLSQDLGLPVVRISALKRAGLTELKEAILSGTEAPAHPVLHVPQGFMPVLERIKSELGISNQYLAYQALLIPDYFPFKDPERGKQYQKEANIISNEGLISNEILVRYDRIGNILTRVVQKPLTVREHWSEKLDKVLLHPVFGYGIFVMILLLIFQAIFNWAEYPMDAIDKGMGALGSLVESLLPSGWFSNLMVEGVIAGLGGIIIFIPQIVFLFLFISILEESGYMSRVVFLMDRIVRPFGFSGKSVIPLIGGMACAIPSIMMTRNIPGWKERLITIMVTPLMSCSARIPVYILLIGMFVPQKRVLGFLNQQGLVMFGIYLFGFLLALAVAWIFKKLLKQEKTRTFILEMPIYRLPSLRNVGFTIYEKSRSFVVEAGRVIIVISIILWFLASFGPGNKFDRIDARYDSMLLENTTALDSERQQLEWDRNAAKLEASFAGIIGKAIEPAIRPLGFDWKIGIALITSFAAREVFVGTMATIYSVGEGEGNISSLIDRMKAEKDPLTGKPRYTAAVAISLLIFYAIAMQCMSTLAVTRKETRSWFWTAVMLAYLTTLAYVASLLTYQLLA
jgi:ferrous iron transport protein B